MSIRINADLPDPPTLSGREYIRWMAEATGPIWAEDDANGWTIAARMVLRDGEWVAAEFRMFPTTEQPAPGTWSENPTDVPGKRGLTATDIDKAGFFPLVTEATRRLQAPDLSGDDIRDDYLIDNWIDLIGSGGVQPNDLASHQPKRRGRPGLDPVELAEIADLYDQAMAAGEKKPIQWIADQLNEDNQALISQRVSKARKRGFLTPAPAKGVMGGRATTKTTEIINARKRQEDEAK